MRKNGCIILLQRVIANFNVKEFGILYYYSLRQNGRMSLQCNVMESKRGKR